MLISYSSSTTWEIAASVQKDVLLYCFSLEVLGCLFGHEQAKRWNSSHQKTHQKATVLYAWLASVYVCAEFVSLEHASCHGGRELWGVRVWAWRKRNCQSHAQT